MAFARFWIAFQLLILAIDLMAIAAAVYWWWTRRGQSSAEKGRAKLTSAALAALLVALYLHERTGVIDRLNIDVRGISYWIGIAVGYVVIWGICYPTIFALSDVAVRSESPLWIKAPWSDRRLWLTVVGGTFLCLVWAGWLMTVASANESLREPLSTWPWKLPVYVAAGTGEELLFRGWIQGFVLLMWGASTSRPRIAMLLVGVAVLFSGSHFAGLMLFAEVLPIGLFYGLVAYRWGLIPAMICHTAFDVLIFFLAHFI